MVIKKLDSKYVMNSRTDDWFKVKPDYMDELGETFEVLAVGGFWGKGKRGGKLGSFLVGLVDQEGSDPSRGFFRYKTLCRVGTGLSVDETEQIMTRLQGKYLDWDKKRPDLQPDWLDIGGSTASTPDVWWNPRDSFLLTIKGAEIIPSNCYGCRFSIRFPRSIRFQIDRDISDCMSFTELLGVMSQPHEKTNFGKDLNAHVKKRQRISEPSQPTSSLRQLKRSDSHKIFYGAEFWILQGLESTAESKNELELLVNKNGGKVIHALPRPAPDREQFCIGLKSDFWDAQKAIRHGIKLIHPQWILDSVVAGHRINHAQPRYMVGISASSGSSSISLHSDGGAGVKGQNDLRAQDDHSEVTDDEYNTDGGEDHADESSSENTGCEDSDLEARSTKDEISEECDLDTFPQKLPSLVDAPISESDHLKDGQNLSSIDKDSESDPEEQFKKGIFHPLVFYLDCSMMIQTSQDLTSNNPANHPDEKSSKLFSEVHALLRENGGKVVCRIDHPALTHIICSPSDTSRRLDLARLNQGRSKRLRLVLTDWVYESVESDACLCEADYIP